MRRETGAASRRRRPPAAPCGRRRARRAPPAAIAAIWPDAAGREGDQDEGENCDRRARPVGREALRHAEHRLRDDGDRDQLEAVQQPLARRAVQRARAIGEERHRDRRRQGEAGPGRERAEIAGAHEADGEPDLAARGPRQELAERTRSANARSSSQPRSTTNALRK